MNSSIEPRAVLRITEKTFDRLRLEIGFSSFSEAMRYELRELASESWLALLSALSAIIPLLIAMIETVSEAFEEGSGEGWLVLGSLIFALHTVMLTVVASYKFSQSWTFDCSTGKLSWTGQFLLGARKKHYRLSDFSTAAILEPKHDFYNSRYVLALVGKKKRLLRSDKILALVRIAPEEATDFHQRIRIHQQIVQEISGLMGWPVTPWKDKKQTLK